MFGSREDEMKRRGARLETVKRKCDAGDVKTGKTKRASRRRQPKCVREGGATYTTARPVSVAPDMLPGFDADLSPAQRTDPTYSIEAGFRRYGLEGEDVFLALAARCVQETHGRRNGFRFFQYERGLQVLDLVTHDRQMGSLLARLCAGDQAVARLAPWYQYFVGRRFREGSGKFFTPRLVARSMASLLPLDAGIVVCDPTCGGGTFLAEAARLLNGIPCELVGNDVDRTLVGLTEAVLFLTCSASQRRRLFCHNVYDKGEFVDAYANRIDCILANPPFSLPLESVGTRSALFNMGYHNSDAVFLDVCLDLLKEGGHLVCLLPHSIVVNTDYAQLRSQVEREWDLCGVITLPEGVFYMTASTTTRADIIHLRKRVRTRTISPGKVYFANAPTVGEALNSRDTMTGDNALEEVATTVRARGCLVEAVGPA